MGSVDWPGGAAPSARSILLTVLGEFVNPGTGTAWTGSLLEVLGALGVEEKSARQALSRTAAEGLLTSTRHGRKVCWALTEPGVRLLTDGAARIYGFMREAHHWDGSWLVLSVAVPEPQRQLRHRLRTRLTWLGMGSPAAGLWVIPDRTKEPEVREVIAELGLEYRAFAWVGPAAEIGDLRHVLALAWDLADVEKRYLAFIDFFEHLDVPSNREALLRQVQMVHEWRAFPFVDPHLPGELLEHDWPGPLAASVFHTQHDRWIRRAQRAWAELEREAAER